MNGRTIQKVAFFHFSFVREKQENEKLHQCFSGYVTLDHAIFGSKVLEKGGETILTLINADVLTSFGVWKTLLALRTEYLGSNLPLKDTWERIYDAEKERYEDAKSPHGHANFLREIRELTEKGILNSVLTYKSMLQDPEEPPKKLPRY